MREELLNPEALAAAQRVAALCGYPEPPIGLLVAYGRVILHVAEYETCPRCGDEMKRDAVIEKEPGGEG